MGPAPHRTSCQERDPHGTSCGPAWLLRSPPAASAGRPHCPQPWWRGEGHGVPRTGPLGHTRSPATAQLQPAPPALFLLRVLEGKGAGSLLAALPWPLCGLGLCSEAATPRHRQPGGNPESRQNPAARCKVHQDNPHPTSHPKPSPQDVCRIFVSPEVPRFHLGPGTDHHPTRCKRLLVVEIADWRSAKCCPVLLCLQPTTSPPAVHLPCRVSITLKAYISSQELM